MSKFKVKFNILLPILFLIVAFWSWGVNVQAATSKKILCINSYGQEANYVKNELSAFANNCSESVRVMPVVESMNCNSMNNVEQWQSTMQKILAKHPSTEAIILVGNEAVITYLSMAGETYRQTPLYILQCNTRLASLPEAYGITSVVTKERFKDFHQLIENYNVRYAELTDFKAGKNLDLIQRLYGNTKDIAVFTDNTYQGYCMAQAVKEESRRFNPWNFHYIDGRKYSMKQALEKVKDLPQHTVLLFGNWEVDKNGEAYPNNAIHAFKNVRSKLLAPTFTFTGEGFGHWPIGGYFPHIPQEHKGLAEILKKDIESDMQSPARIYTLPMGYMFDAKVMQNLQISKDELPEQAFYINSDAPTKEMLEKYQKYAIMAIISIILLTIILFITIAYSIRLKRLQKDLKKSQNDLLEEKEMLEKSQYQLRIAKERAEEAVAAKNLFVANMSHEIRTPLNSIAGFSQVLTEMVKEQPEAYEFAEIIQQNAQTLSQLIDSLFKISDIRSGKAVFELHEVELISFVKGIAEDMQKEKPVDIKLKFTSPYQSLKVMADMQQLLDIIMKLLHNAFKYTEKGNVTLNVNVDPTRTMALISVTDTGCGISKEISRVLFDRFDKTEEFIQGTGMSLTICQSIVEAMGGKIWLDEDYTQGARFIFSLPLLKD